MKLKFLSAYSFYFFFSVLCFSQSFEIPYSIENNFKIQSELYNPENNNHTAIKPIVVTDFVQNADSAKKYTNSSEALILPFVNHNVASDFSNNKLILENGLFFYLRYKKSFYLMFNPVFGNAFNSAPYFLCNNFIDTLMEEGMGFKYGNQEKYSYQSYSGILTYKAKKFFTISAGKGKNFWGDGYRSLFLSDIAAPYPFAKADFNAWKIKYSVLYAMHDHIGNAIYKNDLLKKYGVFHCFSYNVNKRLNFSFFESIVWQGTDSLRERSFDANYLNPVVFFRPIEYSLGSSDNAFIGFSVKVSPFNNFHLYTQLLLDEFYLKEIKAANGWWANKFGINAGVKWFNAFRISNLFLQGEINLVRPYTYAHGSVQQNYGHSGQSLAHVLGANFHESVAIADYTIGKFNIRIKSLIATVGLDSNIAKNYGQNIFNSYTVRPNEYGNYIGQGIKTGIISSEMKLSYLLLKKINLNCFIAAQYYSKKNIHINNEMIIVTAGIKTSLWNDYRREYF